MMLISNRRLPPAGIGSHGDSDFRATLPAAVGRPAILDRIPLLGPTVGHLVDWSEALNAVPTRLRQIVGQRLVTDSGLPVSDARAQIQIEVLECATAMDLLNNALLGELRRSHQVEREALSTPHALAPERADPTDRPAGGREARKPVPRDRQTPMNQRKLFRQRLDQALSAEEHPGSKLALLVIDLEGLKPITETHGPDINDHVLQIIAARLSRAVRAGDVLSRIAFQEFGCLLTGPIDRTQLSQVASKMFDAASAPLRIGTLWLHVNPSIGIAHGAACASGAAGMLLGASGAMLQARQQHSGFAFFDPPTRHPSRPARTPHRPDLPEPAESTP